MTNKEFAKKDNSFITACIEADVPATKRQASKYRNGYGAAYRVFTAAKND